MTSLENDAQHVCPTLYCCTYNVFHEGVRINHYVVQALYCQAEGALHQTVGVYLESAVRWLIDMVHSLSVRI